MKKVVVTGSAGFIGFHLSSLLLKNNCEVLGLDSINSYYDVRLKEERNKQLEMNKNFQFLKLNLCNKNESSKVINDFEPDYVIHLAAQAGVRYSISNPEDYVDSNLIATFNILEILREIKVKHLLIASTSSAYGASKEMPFRESNSSNEPLTFYASTKELVS